MFGKNWLSRTEEEMVSSFYKHPVQKSGIDFDNKLKWLNAI